MRRLDSQYHLTDSRNDEILDQWLLMAVRNRYAPAYPRLEEFLTTVGRRKYVKPLYEAMSLQQAMAIYEKARPMYHPITQATIDTPDGRETLKSFRTGPKEGTRWNESRPPGDSPPSGRGPRGESAICGSR